MAVRKLKRKNSKTGKSEKTQNWHVIFTDRNGREHRFSAGPDKGAAQSMERQVKKLVACSLSGDYPPGIQQFIDDLPGSLKKRFVKWGILSGSRVAVGQHLSQHLQDWKASLLSKGSTEKHAEQLYSRVRRVFTESGFHYWPDISASKIMQIIDGIQTLVRKKNKKTNKVELSETGPASDMTKRHHLRAVKQFAKWMKADGRASLNPLEHLTRSAQVTNQRRALTVDEIKFLLDYTRTAPPVYNVPGPERALIYRLAIDTGLRANEIANLKRRSFDFEELTVKLPGKHTKNRKAAILPLRGTMASQIKDHLSKKMPNALAFRMPTGKNYSNAGRMLKKDLEKARTAWIMDAKDNPKEHRRRADSDFMKTETYEGKIDFHALRHTCSTLLNAFGTDAKAIQTHMRHATLDMTMSIYTHAEIDQVRAALDNLPDFESQEASKTGTDNISVDAVGEEMPVKLPDKKTPIFTPIDTAQNGISRHEMAQQAREVQNSKNRNNDPKTTISGIKNERAWKDSNPQPSVPKKTA